MVYQSQFLAVTQPYFNLETLWYLLIYDGILYGITLDVQSRLRVLRAFLLVLDWPVLLQPFPGTSSP